MTYWTTTETPAGPFTFIADDDAVLASGWTDDVDSLLVRIADDVRPDDVAERAGSSAIVDAVAAYHEGDLEAPAAIAVRQASGPFITAAWAALRKVAPGEVITYSDLAARAGRPAAVRAAASACARNPSALFVPCHRVARRDDGLGGFAWGLDVKHWLLDHERHNG
ncbi:MAG: methylated-DNA--[protein]-cysteine S-methyltransferase [Actinobacteria bacterium]|nr:methylated-DNA--[protein]-cysteine S-methyltransferase [Actinomycetota bacterium]